MTKYFRVIKDNPLWEVGAILSNSEGDRQFLPIEEIWNKNNHPTEYLSIEIVENQPDFFERVYKSEWEKLLFMTKDAMKEFYEKFVK